MKRRDVLKGSAALAAAALTPFSRESMALPMAGETIPPNAILAYSDSAWNDGDMYLLVDDDDSCALWRYSSDAMRWLRVNERGNSSCPT